MAMTNAEWIAQYQQQNPAPTNAEWQNPDQPEGLSNEELKYMFPPPEPKVEPPAPRTTDQFVGEYLKGTTGLPMPEPAPTPEPEQPVSQAKQAMDKLVPDTAPVSTTPTLDIWKKATAMGKRGEGLFRNNQGNFFFDAVNPFDSVGVKTEKDMTEPSLQVARNAVKAIFDSGRAATVGGEGDGGIQLKYADLPNTQKGSRPEHVVGVLKGQQGDVFTKAQEQEGGLPGIAMTEDPVVQFATSIGNGTLYYEDGNLYLYDSYDFSPSKLDPNSGYSMMRFFAGVIDQIGGIENHPSLLNLGKASDILGKDWEAKIKNSGIKGIPKERVGFIERYMQKARD
jgi:hypothetical protein